MEVEKTSGYGRNPGRRTRRYKATGERRGFRLFFRACWRSALCTRRRMKSALEADESGNLSSLKSEALKPGFLPVHWEFRLSKTRQKADIHPPASRGRPAGRLEACSRSLPHVACVLAALHTAQAHGAPVFFPLAPPGPQVCVEPRSRVAVPQDGEWASGAPGPRARGARPPPRRGPLAARLLRPGRRMALDPRLRGRRSQRGLHGCRGEGPGGGGPGPGLLGRRPGGVGPGPGWLGRRAAGEPGRRRACPEGRGVQACPGPGPRDVSGGRRPASRKGARATGDSATPNLSLVGGRAWFTGWSGGGRGLSWRAGLVSGE